MEKPRVVFFGTGPVAAKSLDLLAEWADVEAVITKPKPEHHRGDYPVLDVAEKLGLKVLTVTDKKSLNELMETRPVRSELAVLVDFGIIVSQDVIDYFPLGIINSHFSVLPEWRGADPITFAILSGQDSTGVSIMLLTAGLDEGPLLAYGECELDGTETTAELTEKLIDLSDALLKSEVPQHLADPTKGVEQAATGRDQSYSRKLTKNDSKLDFTKPAKQLEREVRAFADWPKSRTTLANKEVVITAAHVQDGSGEPGTIWHEGRSLGIHTSNGILVVDKLKPAGKAEMTAEAFLAGYGRDL
jgi:methionyl-tRNA formyltransferase